MFRTTFSSAFLPSCWVTSCAFRVVRQYGCFTRQLQCRDLSNNAFTGEMPTFTISSSSGAFQKITHMCVPLSPLYCSAKATLDARQALKTTVPAQKCAYSSPRTQVFVIVAHSCSSLHTRKVSNSYILRNAWCLHTSCGATTTVGRIYSKGKCLCSDLSNNQLRGRLRWNWGQLPPSTGYVNLSGNSLSGALPEAWYQDGGMQGIDTLYVSHTLTSWNAPAL